MKLLYDFLPLLLFFAAAKLYDIYVATAVAIVASLIQVGAFWLRHRRFETMPLVTLGVIATLGGLTLALHDDVFIKWKPTIVNWVFAILVLASQFLGRKTIVERLLSSQIALPYTLWRRLNMSWAIFFIAAGALNLYVAFYFMPHLDEALRTDIWINFKVFGLTGLTLIFVFAQAIVMAKHVETPGPELAAEKERS